MDAPGASAPEPDRQFEEITARLHIDTAAIEQDAAAPETPAGPAAAEPPTTPSPAPAPKPDPERPTAPNPVPRPQAPAPAPAVPAAVVQLPQPTPRPPVKPQRPELSEPVMPDKPGLGRAEQTGHIASITGYALSVGVGAFGQIMFFGSWLETMIPTPGNWVAAAIGAAFAEIGMIGAGNSSLTKRRDGGTWKLLFAVACFVCAGAVTMQVAHWLPKGFGVALVFGLASFVGFLIHMVIEHSKIRDFEDRKAVYATELAAYQAEQRARYEQDLAEYNAAIAAQREREEAERKRVDRARHAGPAGTARELARGPSSARPAESKPTTNKVPSRRVLDRETAYAWSKANDHPGPTAVKKHFDGLGFETKSISTLRDWINGRQP